MYFKCPVCGLRLFEAGRSLYCPDKHTFDISKEGYVNLLLSNQKSSKNPGDSKEMLLNRNSFLNSGYYDPLLSEIKEIIGAFIEKKPENNLNILDLGCGEGYYICKLKDFFETKGLILNYYGVDISKFAVSLASKKRSGVNFIVGNSFLLPFFDESFDIIFSVFSQYNIDELKRILKPESILITVGPGKNHLFGFIKMIYDKPFQHTNIIKSINRNNFELIQKKEINYVLNLQKQSDINNLLIMTPYFWQASPEKQRFILELTELEVEVNFNIEVYRNIR